MPVLKPHKNENPTIRWVSDFCPLNEKTKPLIVALPSVEDNLLLLSNSKYFSSLDFSQGYFHLEVHPDSLKYLYGACPNYFICYQKKGASGSEMREYSSWGVRNLHNKLPLHLQKQIVCYLDDLLIHSPILEQHLKILSELFSIASGVILNTPKCELIKTSLEYLGFTISLNQISVKQSYLGKISDWPVPQTLKNLESFLGFLSYYSSLIPYFSQRAFNLSGLRRLVRNNKAKFQWS